MFSEVTRPNKIFAYCLLILVLVGCANIKSVSTSNSAKTCDISVDEISVLPTIKVLDQGCSEKYLCNVKFSMYRRKGVLKFQKLIIKRNSLPGFVIPLETKIVDSLVTTEVTSDIEFLDDLDLYAIYKGRANCTLPSIIKLKHNKKRNRLDAIVIAPIR